MKNIRLYRKSVVFYFFLPAYFFRSVFKLFVIICAVIEKIKRDWF